MPKYKTPAIVRWTKRAALVAVAFSLLQTAAPGYAQETRRPNLLELLFGIGRQAEPPPAPPAPKRTSKRTSGSVTTISTKAATAPAPVEKLENARKILVVGDFFANGLADGLTEAFADSPGVQVVGRSNGSSGLVRDDYYDWQAELPAILDEVKPMVVVAEIGANDRQQMTTADGRVDFRTEAWFKEYEARVTAFAKQVSDRNLPLLWVGLPAFSSSKMTADAITLNGIFRKAITKAGGEFIDIWDGFVDLEGRFIVTGSDIKGQQVRLRGSDGINLTAAGKRKIAFYVEKSARRLLGDMASPELVRLDASNLPELVSLPPSEISAIVRTRPIDFSDPDFDGASELLGQTELSASPLPTPRDVLVETGLLPPAPAGRVDDFRIVQTGSTKK